MPDIGHLNIPSRILLAPLAGISDLPFRLLCRRHGCRFAYTEMLSARALVYQSGTTLEMLKTVPEDGPIGIQFLGNEPDIMVRALDLVADRSFDLVDINAACPVPKVVRRGEGAGIMKDPKRLQAVLREVVKHTNLPVTVKIRSGWDDQSINAMDVALAAQDAGIHGLTIHGRTRAQGYRGRVNYEIIREVKRVLSIPVIASGDALSPRLVKKLFEETGCDGVAIARGALGNPWIFEDTVTYLETGTIPPRPGYTELTSVMKDHLDMCIKDYGERQGTIRFRKFYGWYIRGIPGNKPLKESAFRAQSRAEMVGLIDRLLPHLPFPEISQEGPF